MSSHQYYLPDSSHDFSTTVYVGAEFSEESLLHPNHETEPTKFSIIVSVIGQWLHIIIFVIKFKLCWKDFYVHLLSSTSFPINVYFMILFFDLIILQKVKISHMLCYSHFSMHLRGWQNRPLSLPDKVCLTRILSIVWNASREQEKGVDHW